MNAINLNNVVFHSTVFVYVSCYTMLIDLLIYNINTEHIINSNDKIHLTSTNIKIGTDNSTTSFNGTAIYFGSTNTVIKITYYQ